MAIRLYFLLLIVFQAAAIWAQIPPDRLYPWAAHSSPLDTVNWQSIPSVDFTAFPFVGNDDDRLTAIWNQYGKDSLQIYFPAGDYYFENTISLGSWSKLLGDGAPATKLHFTPASSTDFIRASGQRTTDTLILSNLLPGSTGFSRSSAPAWLTSGTLLYLIDNDIALVTSAWATGTSGQLIRVDSVAGNQIHFSPPIRRNLTGPVQAYRIQPVKHPAIEYLEIVNNDSASMQTSNIEFTYAYAPSVRCVTSRLSNFAHISFNFSMGGQVRNSAFLDAHSHGGGGRGYGVVLQYATGDVVVLENYFDYLRHSILLQAGANGNAILYNYSTRPYWTETSLPDDSPGELVLHGNYPYVNLFEGNWVQNIVIDDSHGRNGPNNVFFRNRASGYGIFMNFLPPSDSQVYVGNIIDPAPAPQGLYFLNGTGHFTYGNSTPSGIQPAGTSSPTDASLYFTAAPDYYAITNQWPLFDPIATPGSFPNNAASASVSGLATGGCLDYLDLPSAPIAAAFASFDIWPNPAKEWLFIESSLRFDANHSWSITDLSGQTLWRGKQSDFPLRLDFCSPGTYLLRGDIGPGKLFIKQ